MSDAVSAQKPKKKRRWLRRLAWGLVIAVAVAALARGVAGMWVRHEFNARVAALRQAEVPVDLTEMAPPAVSEGRNAAPLYGEALKRLDVLTKKQVERIGCLGRKLEPLDENELIDARGLLAETEASVDELMRGAERPACRYDVDYSADPLRMRLPHLNKLRLGVALLRVAAEVDAADGRTDESFAHTSAALRVARSVREEPMLVSMLVDLAGSASALRELEIELGREEPSDAALAAADRAIGPAMTRERFMRAIRAERCGGIAVMRLVMDDPNSLARYARGGETGAAFRFWVSVGVTVAEPYILHDGLAYLDIMDRMEGLAAEPFRWGAAEWRIVNRDSNDQALRHWIAHPFLRVEMPSLPRAMQVFDYGVTRAREARIAVALRRWRLAHGSYPDSLDDLAALMPEPPTDPFSGRAFHYRRDGAGFLIFSIGPNARDDSGENADTAGAADDIAWRCGR